MHLNAEVLNVLDNMSGCYQKVDMTRVENIGLMWDKSSPRPTRGVVSYEQYEQLASIVSDCRS